MNHELMNEQFLKVFSNDTIEEAIKILESTPNTEEKEIGTGKVKNQKDSADNYTYSKNHLLSLLMASILKKGDATLALMRAIDLCNVDACRALLQSGIQLQDKNGITALHKIIENYNENENENKQNNDNYKEIFELILASPQIQDILNLPDNFGHTPLMLAVDKSNANVVKILLNKGANPHLKEKNQLTALLKAIKNGNIDTVDALLAEESIKNSPWILNQALNYAAMERKSDLVKLLIEKYKAPNLPDNEGNIPLHFAFYGGDETTIKILTEQFGDEASQRKKDPELDRYLDCCKTIKNYAQIFKLEGSIQVRTPNSKNNIFIATDEPFVLNSISLLNQELNKYMNTIRDKKTRSHFQKIHQIFVAEERKIRMEPSLPSSQDQNSLLEKELFFIKSTWQKFMLTLGIYNGKLFICNEGHDLFNTGTHIFKLNPKTKAYYLTQIRSLSNQTSIWDKLKLIAELIDANQPCFNIANKGLLKSKYSTFMSLQSALIPMLYLLKMEELEVLLYSNNKTKKDQMRTLGIFNESDLKQAALKYARKNCQNFSENLLSTKLHELMDQYKNTENNEKRKIYRELLSALLIQYTKTHELNSKKQSHTRTKKKALLKLYQNAKLILNTLTEFDQIEVIESLNNDKIDLLSFFIQYREDEAIQMIVKAGASIGVCFRNAALLNRLDIIQYLIGHQLVKKINETNEYGQSAIQIAGERGYLAITKLLLDNGAEPYSLL